MVFGVAGTGAVELPEFFDVVERYRRPAGRLIAGVHRLRLGQVQ